MTLIEPNIAFALATSEELERFDPFKRGFDRAQEVRTNAATLKLRMNYEAADAANASTRLGSHGTDDLVAEYGLEDDGNRELSEEGLDILSQRWKRPIVVEPGLRLIRELLESQDGLCVLWFSMENSNHSVSP